MPCLIFIWSLSWDGRWFLKLTRLVGIVCIWASVWLRKLFRTTFQDVWTKWSEIDALDEFNKIDGSFCYPGFNSYFLLIFFLSLSTFNLFFLNVKLKWDIDLGLINGWRFLYILFQNDKLRAVRWPSFWSSCSRFNRRRIICRVWTWGLDRFPLQRRGGRKGIDILNHEKPLKCGMCFNLQFDHFAFGCTIVLRCWWKQLWPL